MTIDILKLIFNLKIILFMQFSIYYCLFYDILFLYLQNLIQNTLLRN